PPTSLKHTHTHTLALGSPCKSSSLAEQGRFLMISRSPVDVSQLKDHAGDFACLKGHTIHFALLSPIYSVFIHVTLLTIIARRIKPCFSFCDILQNFLIFQNQIFKPYTHLKN
ncbi:hypothetical protein LDENG_00257660, partial [Lucifuga dentata]